MNYACESLLAGLVPEDINTIHHLRGVVCIYLLVNNVNGKIYVGRTVDARNRIREHFTKDYTRYNGRKLSNAKDFYGVNKFSFYVVETCEKDEVADLEKMYLDLLLPFDDNGYNIIRNKTDEQSSFIMEDDHKKKISQSLISYYRENENVFKGRTHSKESIELIKKNVRNEDGSLKNKWIGSDEQKSFMKEIAKKDNAINRLNEWIDENGHPRRRKIVMIEKKTLKELKEFDSISEASESTGIARTAINNCLSGISKTSGGYIWKYVNQSDQD